jgi:phthiocerol/phenolphthiocerol synthesis type-I polyketide synthase E
MSNTTNELDSIAVVGMSGSFPKAKNINAFWENLKNGTCCISNYSIDDLLNAGIDEATLKNPSYIKSRGFLENCDLFDADFFGIGPKEAELMDPQHRLFLECAWSSLEHAGYNPITYEKLIGIYAGQSMGSYAFLNVMPTMMKLQSSKSLQAAIGNDKDSLTTTIAYHLNLRGPAITIQTSSSTSLVAVVIACQQLLTYQCDIALAGGVSAGPPLVSGYIHEEGGICSADGLCRPFDHRSSGFVPGSGMGIVVLKRLNEAIAEKDTIWAVIKGFGINNDGSKKVSYSAPSVDAQSDVIHIAQCYADVLPEAISYVETHGTATKLGDAVEIAALSQAFKKSTFRKEYCAIGSVKSNIGHLDAAAGIAGFIKTVLCLKHKTLVPTVNFEKPNPELQLEDTPFFVSTKTTQWKTAQNAPLCAGVTSLGMGGTNAHVILEEPPQALNTKESHHEYYQVFNLSAKTSTALLGQIKNLLDLLNQETEIHLKDISYTLNVGRMPMQFRLATVAKNKEELVSNLEILRFQTPYCISPESQKKKIAFFYPHTSFHSFRDNNLNSEPAFQEALDECNHILRLRGIDINQLESNNKPITDTFSISDLKSFIFEYAASKLWKYWGLIPDLQVSKSYGEIAAAVSAKVMTLEKALTFLLGDELNLNDLSNPKIPCTSSISGTLLTDNEATSVQYWMAIRSNKHTPKIAGFVEEGLIFLSMSNNCLFSCVDEAKYASAVGSGKSESSPSTSEIYKTLGKLFELGIHVDWNNVYNSKNCSRIPLPTYPFQRKRYWLDTDLSVQNNKVKKQASHSRPNLNTPYSSSETSEQAKIVELLEEVLGIAPIGIDDNFFDLSGDSLAATSLLTDISRDYNKKITLKEFYANPTPRLLAKILAKPDEINFEKLLSQFTSQL